MAEDPEEDVGGRLTLFLVGIGIGVVLILLLYSLIDGKLRLFVSSVAVWALDGGIGNS